MIRTVARLRASKWTVALLFAIVVTAIASVAVALSCAGDDLETLTLELERVEVDGQEQTDTSAYEDLQVWLEARWDDTVKLEANPKGQLRVDGRFDRQEVSGE